MEKYCKGIRLQGHIFSLPHTEDGKLNIPDVYEHQGEKMGNQLIYYTFYPPHLLLLLLLLLRTQEDCNGIPNHKQESDPVLFLCILMCVPSSRGERFIFFCNVACDLGVRVRGRGQEGRERGWRVRGRDKGRSRGELRGEGGEREGGVWK